MPGNTNAGWQIGSGLIFLKIPNLSGSNKESKKKKNIDVIFLGMKATIPGTRGISISVKHAA